MENIKCPKCRAEIEIVKETNWDNLDTYLYPVCKKCGWTTKEVFYNPEQIIAHINGINKRLVLRGRNMEKVYEIEFMQYTNCLRDTVSDGGEIGKTKYIDVGKEPFLIKESEFDKYMKFGKGFRVVRFVGNMEV